MAEEENQNTKTVLTPDEYQNRLVDFYSQTLGATGIDVGDDEDEDDKEDEYTAPNIMPNQSGDDRGIGNIPNVLDIDYDIDSIVNNMELPKTYQDHLASINRDDKSDLGKLDKSIQQANKKMNDSLQKNFGISIGFPSQAGLQKQTAITGLTAMAGLTGPPAMILGGLISGSSRKGIVGNTEYQAGGFMGVIQDVSESLRLNSYNTNKARYNELKNEYFSGDFKSDFTDPSAKSKPDPYSEGFESYGGAGFDSYMKTKDYGFSANSQFGGSAIYRDHGSRIYNGAGMIGVDQETAKRMEALKRGYSTYNFDPTNPESSGALAGSGKTGYDERGYHHTVNGIAATGRYSDAKALGEEYGLSVIQTQEVLRDVRNRRSFSGRELEGLGLTASLKAKQKEVQAKKRQQESEGESKPVTTPTFTAAEVQKNIDLDDDFTYTSGDNNDYSSTDSGTAPSTGETSFDATTGGFMRGGRVGMREGDVASNQVTVKEPGFIAPDANATKQQEIADDKPMDAKNGDFIINAPAAEDAGKQDIQRMISTAITNLQEKGVDVRFGDPKINIGDKVKLLVSRNEVYIPAIIAKEIGYDRLKKINNRGKREVQRRQEESQQDEKPQARGFIQKKKGDVVTLGDVKYKERYSSAPKARQETEKILRSLPLADGLAIMMYEEANVLGEKGLEGVAHVFVNRADAEGYKDFGNSLIDELLKRTYTKDKIFQFNALEPTKFRSTLKKFKNNEKTYLKVRNIAEEVIAGAREDFTGGALFFKNPKSSTEPKFKSKVDSGEYVETTRSPKIKGTFQHIYYRPKDFGTTTAQQSPEPYVGVPEGFVEIPKRKSRGRPRIPESKGGSFLFRGSDYEKGGATPAL